MAATAEGTLREPGVGGGVPFLPVVVTGDAAVGRHVVFHVGEFDAARERVGGDAGDHLVVGLAVAMRQCIHRLADLGRVAGDAKIVEPGGGVFDNIVERGDDAGGRVILAEHHAQDVEDIGLAVLVDLAEVGAACERDGVFERGSHTLF